MSQREEKLWKDFLQGIRDDNEDQVKRILLETRNLNLGGGKSNFLTRKITTTQGTLTVLHLAVKNGAESIIKLLFKNGVNVNATSEPHKFTALHMAVEQDKNGIIQLLLSQKDVNVNACDEYGHTPLKLAAEKGNQQTVKWLIEKEAVITKADSVDNTAIHVAADKGHYGVLQLLLSSEAFAKNPGIIGKQNKDKNTPLHLAVARECQNCVALLLCYGAVSSLELENRHNETPKQLAKGNKVILELLENPLKAKQHLMELTRPVVKEIRRGGSVEANSDRYPVTEQITSQLTSTSLATVLSRATPGVQPTIMYVTAPQVTTKNEYHTKVGNGGYAAIGPQSALHVEQSAMTTGVQAHLSFSGESSYSINMSGGLASIGDYSVTNVGTATPRTPGSEKLITEDHFELPKRTQFYAQMGNSFKMSGKGGSVEHDGDKDPVTELKPQDSHDTGLPGATSDIEKDRTKVKSQEVLTEESQENTEVHEQVAEVGEKYVDETAATATATETEEDAEGENVIEVTSGGTSWAFKQWAVHLMFPPDAVSEHTSIVVHRWKYSVRSPPLQEHEAITSNVIELSSLNGQELKFNTKVKLSLSHSATDLQGYELVMKKLTDKETNYWKDVDGTRDIRCRQGFEDNHPSHMKITDFFFPVAQADISECSTYAVVCRLKASPTYTITSGGGSFSHPDFPDVTIAIPENAVAPKAKFPLELKVHEVSNEEFEVEGKFLGPVLRIKCFQAVQFLKPVTIQLPISLREQQDLNLNPTTCLVRVLFLKSDNDQKEWIEITDDLVKPPSLDRKFVRFHVERFSAYSHCVEREYEDSRFYGQRIINFYNSRIVVQPTLTVFFAYFRPDLLNILCLMCCPAHLKGKVRRQLKKQGITPIWKNSKKDMVPGHDKASVFVSGGICPQVKSDMEEIYLRLLEHDPDDAELEVRFLDDKIVGRVEFYGISKARVPPLCRLHLRTPTKGTAARSDLRELARQPSARMEDSPTDSVLQHLSKKVSNDWRTLGRQLNFHEADLQEFDNSHRQISEKAYAMLLTWKQRDGSDATYSVLNQALCDKRVKRKDLAQEFCCY